MSTAPNKKKNLLLKSFTVFFVLIAGLILLLPSIVSTWGKGPLLNYYNKKIPGSLQIDDLQLSWFGNQKLNKATLRDTEGQPILSWDSLTL